MRAVNLVMSVMLTCQACGSEPAGTTTAVSPTAVVQPQPVNFAGTWGLSVLESSCDSPWPRYVCSRPPIQPSGATIRLAQLGSHVTGLFGATDVAGEVDNAGILTLTGHGVIAEYGGWSTLTSFEARKTPGGGLEGRIASEWWIPPNFEPLGGTHRRTLTILDGVRGALPSSFSGNWVGHFQQAGCTSARCAGPEKEFELRLQDEGAQLTGTLDLSLHLKVQVAGRSTGDTAELTGIDDASAAAPFRLSIMRIQRSATGRLTGSFRVEYRGGSPEDRELVDVVLQSAP